MKELNVQTNEKCIYRNRNKDLIVLSAVSVGSSPLISNQQRIGVLKCVSLLFFIIFGLNSVLLSTKTSYIYACELY